MFGVESPNLISAAIHPKAAFWFFPVFFFYPEYFCGELEHHLCPTASVGATVSQSFSLSAPKTKAVLLYLHLNARENPSGQHVSGLYS